MDINPVQYHINRLQREAAGYRQIRDIARFKSLEQSQIEQILVQAQYAAEQLEREAEIANAMEWYEKGLRMI